jgi:hypothetical protein
MRGEMRLDGGHTKNGQPRVFPFSELKPLADVLYRQHAHIDRGEKDIKQKVEWVFHRHGQAILAVSHCPRQGLASGVEGEQTDVRARGRRSGCTPRCPPGLALPSRPGRSVPVPWDALPPGGEGRCRRCRP